MKLNTTHDSLRQMEKEGDRIYIPESKKNPELIFDKKKGYFFLGGRSMPYNANDFYIPIFQEVDEYLKNPNNETKVVFKLDYLDSSSSQMILALIYKFKKLFDKQMNLEVEWHYMEDDYDILETGETYSELSGIDFEFIAQM